MKIFKNYLIKYLFIILNCIKHYKSYKQYKHLLDNNNVDFNFSSDYSLFNHISSIFLVIFTIALLLLNINRKAVIINLTVFNKYIYTKYFNKNIEFMDYKSNNMSSLNTGSFKANRHSNLTTAKNLMTIASTKQNNNELINNYEYKNNLNKIMKLKLIKECLIFKLSKYIEDKYNTTATNIKSEKFFYYNLRSKYKVITSKDVEHTFYNYFENDKVFRKIVNFLININFTVLAELEMLVINIVLVIVVIYTFLYAPISFYIISILSIKCNSKDKIEFCQKIINNIKYNNEILFVFVLILYLIYNIIRFVSFISCILNNIEECEYSNNVIIEKERYLQYDEHYFDVINIHNIIV